MVSLQSVGRGATLSLPTAVERARAEFPTDAAARTAAPEGSASLVVERLASRALGVTLGSPPRGGGPGDFVAAYARDGSGVVSRVVVAAGDDVETITRDAARNAFLGK